MFFWIVDRVIHCVFVVVVFCAKDNVGPEWWALYLKKGGHYWFQINLGMALINYALENEWEDIKDHIQTGYVNVNSFLVIAITASSV